MGKKAVDIQRGDLGKVLKTAAGFTVAGLGFLAARHGVSIELQGFNFFDIRVV